MRREREQKRERVTYRRCTYCNASVKTENWLHHLRRAHIAELTPEDKVYIYSQRAITPLVDETLEALRGRAKGGGDLTEFERSALMIDEYGTTDQHELMQWYYRTKQQLDTMVYNRDGLIEENAHYKLADLILATIGAVGFTKVTGKHDPVLRQALINYIEAEVREGDVKTGMDTNEFYAFMEERVILKRLQQLLDACTAQELYESVDRYLAGALVYPGTEQEEYIKTLHANPNHFSARFNLTKLLIRDGHAEDAEPQLRECLKLRPNAYEAAFLLAGLLLDRGAAAEAVTVCETTLSNAALDPKDLPKATGAEHPTAMSEEWLPKLRERLERARTVRAV